MYQKKNKTLITRKELNTMENIFDQEFFNIEATEDVNVYDDQNEVATEVTLGQTIGLFLTAISNIISGSRRLYKKGKLQGTFLDIDKIINSGIPKAQAVSEYKKTVKFLISKRFVTGNITTNSTKIDYSDLTPEGLKFVIGYYDKIGKIDLYTVKTAIEHNKSSVYKQVRAGKILSAIATTIMSIIGGTMVGGILGVIAITLGVVNGGVDIAISAGAGRDERFYNKNQPDDGENEETKPAKESISIFDPNYYEI